MVMWMEEWNTYTFILFLHLLGTKCPMTLQMRCARASILFGTKNTPLVKWWGYLKPGVIKHAKTLNKSQKLPIFHYASAEEYSSRGFGFAKSTIHLLMFNKHRKLPKVD